jgi:hypothetical protein
LQQRPTRLRGLGHNEVVNSFYCPGFASIFSPPNKKQPSA